jgi:hypothetical protein
MGSRADLKVVAKRKNHFPTPRRESNPGRPACNLKELSAISNCIISFLLSPIRTESRLKDAGLIPISSTAIFLITTIVGRPAL